MATITVRNLDVEVQARLKRRAIRDLRGDQLPLPRRSLPRLPDPG